MIRDHLSTCNIRDFNVPESNLVLFKNLKEYIESLCFKDWFINIKPVLNQISKEGCLKEGFNIGKYKNKKACVSVLRISEETHFSIPLKTSQIEIDKYTMNPIVVPLACWDQRKDYKKTIYELVFSSSCFLNTWIEDRSPPIIFFLGYEICERLLTDLVIESKPACPIKANFHFKNEPRVGCKKFLINIGEDSPLFLCQFSQEDDHFLVDFALSEDHDYQTYDWIDFHQTIFGSLHFDVDVLFDLWFTNNDDKEITGLSRLLFCASCVIYTEKPIKEYSLF